MKKKFFIGLFILSTIGLFIFANSVLNYNAQANQKQLQAPIKIPEGNIITMQEAQTSKKPIIALFYVDWCTYCIKFMPLFAKSSITNKDKFTFVSINCENPENKIYMEKYGIIGYPTVHIIDKQMDFNYLLNPASTISVETIQQELEKHLELRAKVLK